MLIKQFRELEVVSRFLNITKAANELYMSQSTLSRHVRTIEETLGFPLFERRNLNKLSVNPVGQLYLDGIAQLIEEYDQLLETCRQQSAQIDNILTVCSPPYSDNIEKFMYEFLDFVSSQTNCSHRLVRPNRKDPLTMIRDGEADLAIVYRFGDATVELESFADQGFMAKQAGNSPLSVWCDTDIWFSKKKCLDIEDLRDVSIWVPNDEWRPMLKPLLAMFDSCSIKPSFRIVNTESRVEFLQLHDPECVFVFPSVMIENSLKARSDLVRIPFNNKWNNG